MVKVLLINVVLVFSCALAQAEGIDPRWSRIENTEEWTTFAAVWRCTTGSTKQPLENTCWLMIEEKLERYSYGGLRKLQEAGLLTEPENKLLTAIIFDLNYSFEMRKHAGRSFLRRCHGRINNVQG